MARERVTGGGLTTMTDLMNTTPLQTSSLARYSESDLAAQPSWLADLRSFAMRRFGEIGFPNRRNEEWRSTSITPIVETPFRLTGSSALDESLLRGKRIKGAYEVVVVNGHYAPELSRVPEITSGVTVMTLAQAIAGGFPGVEEHLGKIAPFASHAFAALNTASITDGVFINIGRGAVVEQPIHLIFVSQPGADATVSHPRVLIVAGENSQSTIVERYEGPQGSVYFTNAVTEAVLSPNALIDHYKVQNESKRSFHLASMGVRLGKSSNFTSHSFSFGGSISRNDITAMMDGEGAEATLNGLVLASGSQLMDSHTFIDHAVPNCPSHEVYKHILDGHSRAVFNGKIVVRLDAQKTDAKQTNKTLLLSPTAQIDTKPQLEIFADDVRCTHGATIGQLSGEQLFYLQSRGIGKEQARDLLVYAFAGEIVLRVKVQALREELDRILLAERHMEVIA